MSNDTKAPREWFIPASVGGFYDGKEVNFAVGPIVDGPLPTPGGVKVIEKSAYDEMHDELASEIDDANRVMALICKERDDLQAQLDALAKAHNEWAERYLKAVAGNEALNAQCEKFAARLGAVLNSEAIKEAPMRHYSEAWRYAEEALAEYQKFKEGK